MSEFNADKVRQQIFGPVGVKYYRAKSLGVAAERRNIAVVADGMLSEAIRCLLVEYDNEARELLRISKEWLEFAIGIKEKPPNSYFHGGTEASRHENLALCNWLLKDSHDSVNLDAAVRNEELYQCQNKLSKTSIEMSLRLFIDAGAFANAITIFERTWPGKPPANPARVCGEAAMSYVVAAAKVRNAYSDDKVRASFEHFLRCRVPKFLNHGGYSYLVRWLKIAFWNDNPNRASAFDTARKCFSYLPARAHPA
jgi:hypothetical protein